MVSKVLVLAFIGLIAVNVAVAADALKCYRCEDCAEPKSSSVCDKDDLLANALPTTSESTATSESTTLQSTTVTDQKRADDTTTTTLATGTPEIKYSCYKLQDAAGKINRGCTKEVKECKDLALDAASKCLKVCGESECNTATNIQSLAFSTIILVAITKMLFN